MATSQRLEISKMQREEIAAKVGALIDAYMASHKTMSPEQKKKADEAGRMLGTKTLTATVDAALAEVIRQHRMKRLIARMRASDGGIWSDGSVWQPASAHNASGARRSASLTA